MSSSDAERWFDSFREGLRRDEEERAGAAPRGPVLSDGPPDLPRYAIGERLGEGAAAIVYRAWDRELGRPVALKVLRDTADVRRSLRARFHREAKIAAGLDHPNIVRVYDLGEVAGRLFMVMELLEGPPSGARWTDPEAPLAEKLRLLEQAARGVAHAHARGVIHRDLKPANILVDGAGEPKVGDFGISLGPDSEPRLTRTGEPLGTPAYMAPEQVRGDGDPTVRTDVYALGAVLYEILEGRPPHGAGPVADLYRRILEEEPEPPRTPSAAAAVAQKALSKDPAGRYADAGEFADDLARVLRGEPARARRPGALRRWGRRLRARPAAAAALAATLAFGLAALAAAASAGTADRNRAALRAAVVRALDREKARLDERYQGLQPVRLVAALQAATERGSDATPPEEIRDLLDYELKKLRVEPELLAVLPPRGRAVYARGPSAALAALEDRRPAPGAAFAAADGRLWLLDGAEVRDTAPEHEGVVRGFRWIGAPIDAAALSGAIPAEAGLVAWTGPDRRVLAGAPFVPAGADRGTVQAGGRSLEDFSEPLPGAVLPVRQHLLVEARGPREGFLLGAGLACAAALASAVLLLLRAR